MPGVHHSVICDLFHVQVQQRRAVGDVQRHELQERAGPHVQALLPRCRPLVPRQNRRASGPGSRKAQHGVLGARCVLCFLIICECVGAGFGFSCSALLLCSRCGDHRRAPGQLLTLLAGWLTRCMCVCVCPAAPCPWVRHPGGAPAWHSIAGDEAGTDQLPHPPAEALAHDRSYPARRLLLAAGVHRGVGHAPAGPPVPDLGPHRELACRCTGAAIVISRLNTDRAACVSALLCCAVPVLCCAVLHRLSESS